MTDSAIGTSSLSSSSSAMSLSSISEQKYTQLRKRLDQLGYRQTLGVESLPLIEKLFNDLVHTTESLKKTKLELNNVSRTTKSSKADLSSTSILNTSANLEAAAYRADNAKLIKENNQLHLDFIKLKDDFDQQIKDLKSKLSKVENENCDLRFLNTQYLTKMRTIERESNSKGRKIIELQERSLHASNAIIQIPNTSDISFSFRRQRLDADSLLPPPVATNLNSSTTISAANHRPNVEVKDPYIIDVVKIADERIQELEALLNQSKQSGEIWEKKCSNLKYQVELRDKEIERLNNLMENGRPRDISQLAIESELESHEKVVKNLNIQIEYLQEKNYQLEKRLEELLEEKQNNASKNRNEPDKNEPIIRQLELEKNDLSNRINVLKSELDDRCTDINNLHALIAKIQEDKTKLSKKISNLLENEKELVREIDSLRYLKRTPSGGRAANKTPPSKLDSYVKNLESERDFYKREIETLQELLKSSSSSNGNSGAYNHHNSRAASKSPATRLSTNGRQQKSMSPPSKLRCSVCANRSQSPSPIAQQQQQQAIEEIKKLKREKDELKGLLDKFEGYMDQIQTNVTHLTSERDQIMDMYNKTKEELNKCKSAINQQSAVNESTKNQAQHHSLAVQTMLHRVESERDTALFDLRNVMKERDSLADRLRHVSETSSKDKLTLETELDNVRERLTTAEIEKSELSHQVKLLKDELDEIESKMKSQSYQLVQAVQDLNDQKSASAQIRLLAEESRNALEEHRMQLKLKNDEIQRLDQHKFHLEQKLLNIQEHNRALQDELGSLRHTISTLDKEKDKLLSTLDEKTVECVTLKQELASKHHRLDELNSQLSQLESSFDTATSHLNSQKKDLNSLRIQLDRVNEENALLARKLDSAVRENKRLQDDMMTVTRESQVLHCELDKLRVEKESFSDKISGYTSELNRYDDAIKQKDGDRQQLLEQLRQMAQDFNGLKLQLGACESELSSCRMDAQGKAVEIKRLRERLDKSERDYQQHLSASQEYEVKLSNCNMSLQKYEEALKQLEAEKKNIVEDLMHFREINMNLEQAKEELARQLTSRELDNEQLSNQMYDRSAEIDLLKSQISSERAMIKNLEELIASNREKDFHLQMNNQEKEGEIKLLKERILIGEQKIQSQNKDLNMLRSKVVEMETETEKLRRQLTNERFERERAAQELRKKIESSCSSSPPTSSLMSSHHMHQHQHIRSSLSPPKKSSILNYSSTSSTTSTTCACPPPNGSQNTSSSANGGGVLILPHPPALTNNSNTSATSSSSSAAAAAVAAAAAAVAASNVAAAASGYRSLSPIRTSTIITKEHSSMRYSS